MSDIPATRDGSDIDFTRDALVSGLDEYRQAAMSRIANESSYTNAAYGLDLVLELGDIGGVATIGIRASAAIMNDERFTSAQQTSSAVRAADTNDVFEVSLGFDVVAEDGTELSLDVLVANGEVVLVP